MLLFYFSFFLLFKNSNLELGLTGSVLRGQEIGLHD
jgi:hypothetical protein